MINEIKTIIENYMSNVKLCSFTDGIVVSNGIKVSDRLIIPSELIVGNLKQTIITGDKVRLLRNHGGQLFYILEVITG